MKNKIQTTKKTINTLLANLTLAKFASAFVTIIMVTLIKYMVSGNFSIEVVFIAQPNKPIATLFQGIFI
jgi:hypothetical protein